MEGEDEVFSVLVISEFPVAKLSLEALLSLTITLSIIQTLTGPISKTKREIFFISRNRREELYSECTVYSLGVHNMMIYICMHGSAFPRERQVSPKTPGRCHIRGDMIILEIEDLPLRDQLSQSYPPRKSS